MNHDQFDNPEKKINMDSTEWLKNHYLSDNHICGRLMDAEEELDRRLENRDALFEKPASANNAKALARLDVEVERAKTKLMKIPMWFDACDVVKYGLEIECDKGWEDYHERTREEAERIERDCIAQQGKAVTRPKLDFASLSKKYPVSRVGGIGEHKNRLFVPYKKNGKLCRAYEPIAQPQPEPKSLEENIDQFALLLAAE